ncbi:hypothetical protein G7Z17_g3617 [Cylindrodendrum hubeiense]|uniref:Major facilitator superfamily (MFS) profile domain-containing protein n=1 Tax=Cylindrodendrum hubeiense TaxID=595255 RepID=A0A9P5HAF9_9HYPO|nr:hypothetical protein G7Z17_g3617 [Cylindrodendrum hubeiense]
MTIRAENIDNPTEASRLLSNTTPGDDARFQQNGYGSVPADCESSNDSESTVSKPKYSNSYIARVVAALLIGVFTSSIDASLVLATHPVIASEFGDLEDSSWLFISFMLAGAATQSLYGKLSDIYGRKPILIVCYGLFAVGCGLVRRWNDGTGLCDHNGSFLGQVPVFVVAALLCWILLPDSSSDQVDNEVGLGNSLARIDGLGAFLLGTGILALMLPLEIGGQKVPWTHPLMMYSVPIYFQVTQRVSSTIAGAHLFPAVIGNTVGGIFSGALIQRNLIIASSIFSMSSYGLMLLRWTGHTGWAESLYVIPGGMGTGIAQSAVFIALQSAINPGDKAVAASGLYLTGTIGCIVGLAASSASTQVILRRVVQVKLAKQGMNKSLIDEVIKKATESVTFIDEAPKKVAEVLVEGYVKGIEYSHGISIIFSFLALIAALLIRERKL